VRLLAVVDFGGGLDSEVDWYALGHNPRPPGLERV
jgi:hypothetical protein